jgi:hypothetical protein
VPWVRSHAAAMLPDHSGVVHHFQKLPQVESRLPRGELVTKLGIFMPYDHLSMGVVRTSHCHRVSLQESHRRELCSWRPFAEIPNRAMCAPACKYH